MNYNKLRNVLILIIGVSLILCGCAAKPKLKVWADPEVSFDNYKLLEVRPVMNETGKVIDANMLSALTDLLRNGLGRKGLSVIDRPEKESGALIMQSDLVSYEEYELMDTVRTAGPAGWGETMCTLRVRLRDRTSNRMVATVVVTQSLPKGAVRTVPLGGASYVNPLADDELLKGVTNAVTDEVANIMLISVKR